ncbi:MAG: ArsA family ATPase [Deltaproteobacteria bacterium]|nr:MAG: ArsA family ATPase [Deltaproteobacteria bacterium]TDJ16189.1 MAG: ArsA family ATPase [Deltaproteobacteria bacterium]
MRLVLYTGKGGVGKTTTAAATAIRAAEAGRRTLVVSADSAHSLGDVLEQRIGPERVEVAPNLEAIEVDVRVEVIRHWGHVQQFLVELFRYQGIDAIVAEELALLPGAEEVVTLLAVEEFALSGVYDFIVVDCAPTDATLRLVTLPDIAERTLSVLLPLFETISSVAVPLARKIVSLPLPGSEVFRDADELLNRQLRALQQRLTNPQTSVRIVLTPERMVIDEARRAWTELSLFEVSCDAVVMNRILPDEASDEPFFEEWWRLQEERKREVEEFFAPLPVLFSPLQDDEATGLERLSRQGACLFGEHEPDAVLSVAPRVRFEREGDGYRASVPMPGASLDRLDVAKIDDELTITTGVRRRVLKLPRSIALLDLLGARLDGPSLIVSFGSADGA